jgi:hypothetical protein
MPLQIQAATTIDEVIEQLEHIIDWAISQSNRIGYFAALYRKVTVAVKDGIQNNLFEDGPRMAELDVIFANRFLEAFQQHQAQQACSNSWLLAFEQSIIWRPLVLQHLMLGMNAHINLDLGVAAAKTMEGQPIENIKTDFFKINDILINLIDEVQDQLSEIFPLLKRFDLLGRFDEIIAEAGMDLARAEAWKIAQALGELPESEWDKSIEELDQKVLLAGHRILQPSNSFFIQIGLFMARLGEYHTVGRKISLLL